jgi:23S rRNA (adenine2503-C2)-methyltransferase
MTHKFVIELEDGARVECVSMRTERRLTFCLSSQAGVRARMHVLRDRTDGLKRNLRAHEIVGQVLRMATSINGRTRASISSSWEW